MGSGPKGGGLPQQSKYRAAPTKGPLSTATIKGAPTGRGVNQDLSDRTELAMWGGGTPQEKFSNVKRQGAAQESECLDSPEALESHSPLSIPTISHTFKNFLPVDKKQKI